MYIIACHDQAFHSDELIAIAMYTTLYDDDSYEIIRTRNPEALLDADVLVDVGGKHRPESGYFDHHQFPKDHPLYGKSSAGLVADHIGLDYQPFLNLVRNVDIRDTQGPNKCDPKFDKLFDLVRDCNAVDTASVEQDEMFNRLLTIFQSYFRGEIGYQKLVNKVQRLAEANLRHTDEIYSARAKSVQVISFDSGDCALFVDNFEYVPPRYLPEDCATPLFLTWDKAQNCWSLTCNTKCATIEAVDNCKFLHKNGFIAKIEGTRDNPQGITGLQLAEV